MSGMEEVLKQIEHLPEINLSELKQNSYLVRAVEVGEIKDTYTDTSKVFLRPIYVAGKVTKGRKDDGNPFSDKKPLLICSKMVDEDYCLDALNIENQESIMEMLGYKTYSRIN